MDLNDNTSRIDELLDKPYWIIDILPSRVPKDSPGQYFAVEAYFLKERISEIKRKHIDLVLKLNCYRDVGLDGETNPAPARIAEAMRGRYVYIMLGDAMILSEPDDTHLTLFNPDEGLLALAGELAAGEGLYVWRGDE